MSPAKLDAPPVLGLYATSAQELMHPNPISIRDSANIQELITLLTDKGFSAAPVIDEAGHPVGVVSRSDVLVHERERTTAVEPALEYYREEELAISRHEGFHVEQVDHTAVRDIMTPAVFTVTPDTRAREVVAQMLKLHVHRLFVVDETGVLIGVISSFDVLRRLR
jgi:CBS domain-containing protein